jgi:hypothetical protein
MGHSQERTRACWPGVCHMPERVQDDGRPAVPALAHVLDAFGHEVQPSGSGGAWIVTGHRAQDEQAGRRAAHAGR